MNFMILLIWYFVKKNYFIIQKIKWSTYSRSKVLNSQFDHMLGLVNGFCDQKPGQSELNRPIDTMLLLTGYYSYFDSGVLGIG